MRMARTVQDSLNKAHCEFDIVTHPHSASSLETARVAGIPAERVAKSVILDDNHGHFLMAVLPASRHLDLSKVRGSGEGRMLTVIPGQLELGTMDHIIHVLFGAIYLFGGLATKTVAVRTT